MKYILFDTEKVIANNDVDNTNEIDESQSPDAIERELRSKLRESLQEELIERDEVERRSEEIRKNRERRELEGK